MDTPTPEEIERLKQIQMKGRLGQHVSRDDDAFLQTVYFGRYKKWWEENGRAIQREVFAATKPGGSDLGWR